jgi:hypothetical protein
VVLIDITGIFAVVSLFDITLRDVYYCVGFNVEDIKNGN